MLGTIVSQNARSASRWASVRPAASNSYPSVALRCAAYLGPPLKQMGKRPITQNVEGRARVLMAAAATAIGIAVPSAVAGVVLESPLWTNISWTVAALGAAGALWYAAEVTPDDDRGGWRILAWASAIWFLGQVLWDVWSLGLPVHVPADTAWLLFAPLSALRPARVASLAARGRQRAWEAVLVIAATGTLITALLLRDVVTSLLGPVERWISVGYPVAYSIVPVMTAQVLLVDRVRIMRRPDLILIALGIGAQAVGFTLWAPRLLDGTYEVGHLLDATWTLGLILI